MLRKNLTKHVAHRNGDVTFTCPDCAKRVRVAGDELVRRTIGGDAYCFVCLNCYAEELEEATAKAEAK